MNGIARKVCKMDLIGFAQSVATSTLFVIESETVLVEKSIQKLKSFE